VTLGRPFGRLTRVFRTRRIATRIVALTVALLAALTVSLMAMTVDLRRNFSQAQAANERFFMLQAAAEARHHFAEARYWLTDLSVSLLTLSERRANEALAEMEADLARVATFAPDAVAALRDGSAAYVEDALSAADAYTDGNRIVGNSRLAAARIHSDQVDRAFAALTARLRDDADAARQATEAAASASVARSALMVALITLLAAVLTWATVQSILTPLGKLDAAMAALTLQRRDVALPPPGDDEFGRMARTLALLRTAQIESADLRQAAQRQRDIIQTAIETIPDGFVIYDAEDRIVLVNQCYHRLFPHVVDAATPGARFEDVLRAHVAQTPSITRGLDPEVWIARRLAVHHALEERTEEVTIGDAWVRIARRRTPDGGVVAVYTDISDLIRRQRDLEAARREADIANQSKSAFLASMSHELRTPLNAIIGYSEILIEDAAESGDDASIRDLEKICQSGRHLLALINDILDLSKIEAGKTEIFLEPVALNALLTDVLETMEPLLAQRRNRIALDAALDDDMVETDRTKLRQILFNLLANANKFSEKGAISLTVGRRSSGAGDLLEIVVRDQGIGMRPETIARLFQPFMQAEVSTTRDFGGTGLGLAITHRFVGLLGGRIEVASSPGQGSAFTVTLPAARPPAAPSAPSEASPTPTAQLDAHGPAVLVIDDEARSRAALAAVIGDAGYRVATAESGGDGLAMARASRPDVIVLDIIMPGRDGWSVLREIKSDAALRDIPVILATAVTDRDMGVVLGAAEHLVKPIAPERLVAEVERFARAQSRVVLVVDDDPATRDLFRRTLARAGWSVRTAEDGAAALREIAAAPPALMLLDLMMPNVDGFEVLKRLEGASGLDDLQIIVVTSKDLSREEEDWLRARSCEIVEKGLTGRADLLAAIGGSIERTGALRGRCEP
jgi:signal transduction histidine kinase/DNA-binding response OmpR family regulator